MSGELEAYKRRIVGIYDRAAAEYGSAGPPIFRHAGRRLVELAGVRANARVLDVATGRGAVLFPAAERVGPTGSVLGVDLSEAMVRETAAEIAARGMTNVEARVMDAEALDLPEGAFDYVFCSFALFFFAHVERVLVRFWHLLGPGGVAGVALAEEIDKKWQWQNELFMRYAALEPAPTAVPGVSLHAPGALVRLLRDAGFSDAREVAEEAELAVGSQEDWLASLWTHGTRRAMEAMTAEGLEQFQVEAMAHLGKVEQGGELRERFRFRYWLARRPPGAASP
jgi:ubiquinone/menaquinone biosynthesis C-methylase UbiE